jgi:hypothetical protein
LTLSTKLELLRTISVLDKGKVKNEGVSKTSATRCNMYNFEATTTTTTILNHPSFVLLWVHIWNCEGMDPYYHIWYLHIIYIT